MTKLNRAAFEKLRDKEARNYNATKFGSKIDFKAGWDARDAIAQDELAKLKEREAKLVKHLELALSFCPKGPVLEGFSPMYYYTLDYQEEVKLQERIDEARLALADHKRMMEGEDE